MTTASDPDVADLLGVGAYAAEDVTEETVLRDRLTAAGVVMCASCGLRPARARSGNRGKNPTNCEVCAARRGRGPGTPKAPPSIKIQVGPPAKGRAKKDDAEAQVRARATQAAKFVAMGLMLTGSPGDAVAVERGAEAWGAAVGGLAEYEPWLVQLCQGEQLTGRAMAWAAVVMATAGIVVPVAINHGLIPEGRLRQLVCSMLDQAEAAVGDSAAVA